MITETIPAEHITGKCYIQHLSAISNLEAWLCHENHFYVQDQSTKPSFIKIRSCDELQKLHPSSYSYCERCYQDHIKVLEKQDLLCKRNKPLQALEIFSGSSFIPCLKIDFQHVSGAGGLSIGLEDSGFVKTKWAIEYAPSAARTFQYVMFLHGLIIDNTLCLRFNKNQATVYNQDCNVLLEHAIQVYNSKNSPPLQSLDGGKLLPPLPKPGEVDLICGGKHYWKLEEPLLNVTTGPPCQGFSHANRHPVSQVAFRHFLSWMLMSVANSKQMTQGRTGVQ